MVSEATSVAYQWLLSLVQRLVGAAVFDTQMKGFMLSLVVLAALFNNVALVASDESAAAAPGLLIANKPGTWYSLKVNNSSLTLSAADCNGGYGIGGVSFRHPFAALPGTCMHNLSSYSSGHGLSLKKQAPAAV